MSKVILGDIDSLANVASAKQELNDNFTALEEAIDNCLSRLGTSPNAMLADIDMGEHKLLNVADPVAELDGVNLRSVRPLVELFAGEIAETHIQGTLRIESFVATAGQTDFVLDVSPGVPENVEVYDQGIFMEPGIDYTLGGTDQKTISFFSGRTLDNRIVARYVELAPSDSVLRSDLINSSSGKGSSLVSFTQTGVGAIARTMKDKGHDVVSVKDFGALGDGVTDDAAAIQAALNSGASRVRLPAGTYMHSVGFSVPADTIFDGDGVKSVLKPLAAMTSMIELVGDYAQARDLNLQNVASRASRGITVTSPFFAKVLDNYLGSLPVGVYIDGAQKGWVERNHMLNCDFGIFSADDGREFRFIGNHVQGGTGMWITKSTQQAEGVKIAFNTLLPSVTSDPNSGHGLVIEAGLEMQIISNMFGNCDKNGILLAATGGNAIASVKIAHGWIDNDTGTANSEGLFIYGNVGDVTVEDYTFATANQRGVHIGLTAETAPQRIDLKNLKFLNNASGDIRIEKGVDIRVAECRFQHATENLREDVNTITSRVYENTFIVAPAPKSTGSRFYDNIGPSGVNDDNGQSQPTITHLANVSASSWEGSGLTWSRTGDTVHFAGRINATPTAAAGTLTQLSFAPPVASNWDDHGDLGGAGMAFGSSSANSPPVYVSGDGGTDKITLTFYAPVTTSLPISFSGSYRIV